VVQNYRS